MADGTYNQPDLEGIRQQVQIEYFQGEILDDLYRFSLLRDMLVSWFGNQILKSIVSIGCQNAEEAVPLIMDSPESKFCGYDVLDSHVTHSPIQIAELVKGNVSGNRNDQSIAHAVNLYRMSRSGARFSMYIDRLLAKYVNVLLNRTDRIKLLIDRDTGDASRDEFWLGEIPNVEPTIMLMRQPDVKSYYPAFRSIFGHAIKYLLEQKIPIVITTSNPYSVALIHTMLRDLFAEEQIVITDEQPSDAGLISHWEAEYAEYKTRVDEQGQYTTLPSDARLSDSEDYYRALPVRFNYSTKQKPGCKVRTIFSSDTAKKGGIKPDDSYIITVEPQKE